MQKMQLRSKRPTRKVVEKEATKLVARIRRRVARPRQLTPIKRGPIS